MTYIPNEGVDMHRDADPGALNVSYCNTMDIIITSGGTSSCFESRLAVKPQIISTATSEGNKQTVTFQNLIRFGM